MKRSRNEGERGPEHDRKDEKLPEGVEEEKAVRAKNVGRFGDDSILYVLIFFFWFLNKLKPKKEDYRTDGRSCQSRAKASQCQVEPELFQSVLNKSQESAQPILPNVATVSTGPHISFKHREKPLTHT